MNKKNKKILSPIKAIRKNCIDCMCGQSKEVRLCPSKDCPLYPYRFGKNPNRKGMGGNINQNKNKNSKK